MSQQMYHLYIFILGAALPFTSLLAQLEAPSTIYVGNGSFSGEYYKFFSDQGGANSITLSEYVFYRGNTYTFERISDNGHPFYLSDTPRSVGYYSYSYHYGSLSIPLSSNADIGQSDRHTPALDHVLGVQSILGHASQSPQRSSRIEPTFAQCDHIFRYILCAPEKRKPFPLGLFLSNCRRAILCRHRP